MSPIPSSLIRSNGRKHPRRLRGPYSSRPPEAAAGSGLRFIHQIPGRARFTLDGASESRFMDALDEACARDLAEIKVSYNRRTGRCLATAPGTFPLRERLESAVRLLDDGAAREGDVGRAFRRRVARLNRSSDHTRDSTSPLAVSISRLGRFFLLAPLLPVWLRPFIAAGQLLPVLRAGTADLARGRLSARVLDASAVLAALGLRELRTAQFIALLLGLGETFEEWTREKSRENLAQLYGAKPDKVWVIKNGKPVHLPTEDVKTGDRVIVRMGGEIPVDGVIESGRALVNQASMTGETIPIAKTKGRSVCAGTAVVEGAITVLAKQVGDETRFAKIVRVIEESEGLKADIQSHSEKLADRIVPWSFLLSLAVWLTTRDPRKAASVLMVDFSCALKLATPLAIKSAMAEASSRGVLVKGGRHLESLARTRTLILDKTGTLTEAKPKVIEVIPLNGFKRDFVLRNAACLEEHFPHPVATAVVAQAASEGLLHEEEHAEVEYMLAHGIASRLHGKRIVVGSRHFVGDDEGVPVVAAARIETRASAKGQSLLYVGIGGRLAGIIVIHDPLRPEAAPFLRKLEAAGVRRIIMLTGDVKPTAATVAKALGIKEVYSQVLPDEKVETIKRLQREGLCVAMMGDGVNDSAALAYADIGISLKQGADIAKEACDVLLLEGRLEDLVTTLEISRQAMSRVRNNYAFVIGANSVFLALVVFGLIPPALNAALHNATTMLTSLRSMRPYLKEDLKSI